MLVVHPKLGVHGFKEFLEYARRNPGKLSYGSVGAGSASHLTMELLKNAAGVSLVHVPYKGFPPAVTDMLAGNIDAMFAIIPGVLQHVRAGKMTGLAVTGLKRSALAPDVPGVAELGYAQLESLAWIGFAAPAGTPHSVLERLSAETMRGMQGAEVRDLLGKQGFEVVAGSPQDFATWIASEARKWSEVVRVSGAKVD
jgi:tripartite-type tricarboxylate transporter receptor subunit TctC